MNIQTYEREYKCRACRDTGTIEDWDAVGIVQKFPCDLCQPSQLAKLHQEESQRAKFNEEMRRDAFRRPPLSGMSMLDLLYLWLACGAVALFAWNMGGNRAFKRIFSRK